jgi:hypothetical protein
MATSLLISITQGTLPADGQGKPDCMEDPLFFPVPVMIEPIPVHFNHGDLPAHFDHPGHSAS